MTREVPTAEKEATRLPRRRKMLFWLTGFGALVAIALFGPGVFATWARSRARADLDVWAISDAIQWIDRSRWLGSDHPEAELLRARCFRYLECWQRRDQALAQARQRGASEEAIDNETMIGRIQLGELYEGAEDHLESLRRAGFSPMDVAWSVIQGCIAQQKLERAEELVNSWRERFPRQAHNRYMRGVLFSRRNNQEAAIKEFETVMERDPRHELAQIALAQLLNQQGQLEQALALYVQLAGANPRNQTVMVGLANSLRKLGRLRQARSVLEPWVSESNQNSKFAAEMGTIELDAGNYHQAIDWFEKVSAKDLEDQTVLSAAGIALGNAGKTWQAEKAFDWIADEMAAVTQIHDMEDRVALDPRNDATVQEFQRLITNLAARVADKNPRDAVFGNVKPSDQQSAGMTLYDEHCRACHGPDGNGDGRGARHLHPPPRNLRRENMRLVSCDNGVPSTDDIRIVIRKGIPGTSMQPLEQLRDYQLDPLADEVVRMRRDGVRADFVASLVRNGEQIVEEEVADVIRLQTSPGRKVFVPDPKPANSESIRRGRQLYVNQTCDRCHGDSGVGDQTGAYYDDLGRPCYPRDLVSELFKGGNTAESVQLRIRLGMPGSPHPATVGLTNEELGDLAHFCESLGKDPKKKLTNHERAIRAARRFGGASEPRAD